MWLPDPLHHPAVPGYLHDVPGHDAQRGGELEGCTPRGEEPGTGATKHDPQVELTGYFLDDRCWMIDAGYWMMVAPDALGVSASWSE